MMKKACLALLCGLVAALPVSAWEWPLSEPVLERDFAAAHHGAYYGGVLLGSAQAEISTLGPGRVVLVDHGDRDRRGRFPLGASGTLLVSHERGLRSLYGGLQIGIEGDPAALPAGARLGSLAPDGQGGRRPLFLRLLDTRWWALANPRVLLPGLEDQRLPVISQVVAELPETGARIALGDRMELLAPSFRLHLKVQDLVGVRDPASGVWRVAEPSLPQELKVIWNGKLVFSLARLALRRLDPAQGLVLVSASDGTHASLYEADGFLAAGELSLAEGLNRLEIRVADLAGNRTSASYRISHPIRPPAGRLP